MTQQRLERLVELWCKRLRLDDWDVNVVLVPTEGLGDKTGECSVYPRVNEATMRISAHKMNGDDTPHDYEQTVVHELLHIESNAFIRHSDVYDSKDRADAFEKFIDKTSKTLVGAYRKGRQR
ncbi:MAG: hypothetical protein V3S43_06455 [Acidimicrobiia bacterium]